MCLVVFAWKAYPDYRLIVAANRDEYHSRPAQDAHWWPDNNTILAGRDLQAGGTWLGLSRTGRFAAVTNYRERQQRKNAARSRGDLVTGFLNGDASPAGYCRSIKGERYSGFSLLAADSDELACVSNRGEPTQVLRPGLYGLSNAALDTPWPKLLRSRNALRSLVDSGEVNFTSLFRLLSDRVPAAIEDVQSDDLPFELARSLTAPFIVTPEYGTRCSSVVLVDYSGRIEFAERSFASSGRLTGKRNFVFSAESED